MKKRDSQDSNAPTGCGFEKKETDIFPNEAARIEWSTALIVNSVASLSFSASAARLFVVLLAYRCILLRIATLSLAEVLVPGFCSDCRESRRTWESKRIDPRPGLMSVFGGGPLFDICLLGVPLVDAFSFWVPSGPLCDAY